MGDEVSGFSTRKNSRLLKPLQLVKGFNNFWPECKLPVLCPFFPAISEQLKPLLVRRVFSDGFTNELG